MYKFRYNHKNKSSDTGLEFDMGVIALICRKANATELNFIHVEFGAPP